MDAQEAFQKFFINTEWAVLRKKALEEGLSSFPLRGLCWRVFLEVVPPNEIITWDKVVQSTRNHYVRARLECFNPKTLPNAIEMVQLSSTSTVTVNIETIAEEYDEVKREIRQDIERTFPDQIFFQDERIRTMMLNILYIYAVQHPHVKYKQGMHELLAVIIFVLNNETMKNRGDLLSFLIDEDYLEHDSATLFFKLMETCVAWFVSTTSEQASPFQKISRAIQNPRKEEYEFSPIVKKCHHIHHDLLKSRDPDLYKNLEKLGIEPQLYGLRWIRLLFGREFPLQGLLVVWDFLFADDVSATVDYMCVAMLIYIRNEIIGQEYISALKHLFTYPDVEDVHQITQHAVRLREYRRNSMFSFQNPIPSPRYSFDSLMGHSSHKHHNAEDAPEASTPRGEKSDNKSGFRKHLGIGRLTSSKKKKDDEEFKALAAENQRLEKMQEKTAHRIQMMVTTIETELNEKYKTPHLIDVGKLLCAVAELKRVKSILAKVTDYIVCNAKAKSASTNSTLFASLNNASFSLGHFVIHTNDAVRTRKSIFPPMTRLLGSCVTLKKDTQNK